MVDEQKTKEQLMGELAVLRQGVARLGTLLTKHKQAGALCDIVQTASQTLEPDDLLNSLLGKAVEVMDADMGLIYLLDRTEKALLLKAHRGMTEETLHRISTVKLTSEDLRKMPKGEAPHISLSELFRDATLKLIAAEVQQDQAQSFAAVPFSGKSGLHGVMIVASRSQHKFNQDDMELLGIVGKQTRASIENAMLALEVSRLATIDRLTGLYNKAYFQQRLEEETARSSRYGLEFSIVLFDVDGFEAYSARRGPAAGNEIIRMLGVSARDCIREVDTAYRYGKSKFAIILLHTGASGAEVVAERLQQKASDIFALMRRSSGFKLTISLGIASFPSDDPSPEGLVHRAEAALTKAKQRGGDQACLASNTPDSIGAASSDIPEATKNVKELSTSNIYAMAAAVDANNHNTHSKNVAKHVVAIGEVLGLTNRKIRQLRTAAILHDIGKSSMPYSITRKSGLLNEEEQQTLRKHPELGAAIVDQIPELDYCAPAIRHHHERYDGSGYPSGLKGEQIPIEARIIAVAEAYDTMTTTYPYRQALSPQEAIEKLRQHINTKFDPEVVLAFIKAVSAGSRE